MTIPPSQGTMSQNAFMNLARRDFQYQCFGGAGEAYNAFSRWLARIQRASSLIRVSSSPSFLCSLSLSLCDTLLPNSLTHSSAQTSSSGAGAAGSVAQRIRERYVFGICSAISSPVQPANHNDLYSVVRPFEDELSSPGEHFPSEDPPLFRT